MSNEQVGTSEPYKGQGDVAFEYFRYPLESCLDKYRVVVERELLDGRLVNTTHWFDSEMAAVEFATWHSLIGHSTISFEQYTRRDLLPVPPTT